MNIKLVFVIVTKNIDWIGVCFFGISKKFSKHQMNFKTRYFYNNIYAAKTYSEVHLHKRGIVVYM